MKILTKNDIQIMPDNAIQVGDMVVNDMETAEALRSACYVMLFEADAADLFDPIEVVEVPGGYRVNGEFYQFDR